VAVGAYSYSANGDIVFTGNTSVSNSSYSVSNNTLTNCTALSSTSSSNSGSSSSYGLNTYGGGISVAVGAYSYSTIGQIFFTGNTTVSNSSYSVSNNTLTNCTASSSTSSSSNQRPTPYTFLSASSSSYGSNTYGGGISVAVGAYSYNTYARFDFTGNTSVSNSSYSVSNNTLTNCIASSSTSSSSKFPSNSSSYGSNTYGGGIYVVVGAYFYSLPYRGNDGLVFTGNTSVSNSSYSVSNNTLTNCTASSSTSSSYTLSSAFSFTYGSNTYGGGISVAVGAYSYSAGNGLFFTGNTSVSNSSYSVSNNMLTNCTALSSTSSSFSGHTASSSYGSNTYGGGISVAVGAYSYSAGNGLFFTFTGNTSVSNSSYSVSNNTLTNCTALSSTSSSNSSSFASSSYGSNTYGGGISVAVGAYSYSTNGLVSFTGNTSVSNSSYSVSNNTLTNCTASSSSSSSYTLSSAFSFTYGLNTYGGGISVAVGAYSYSAIGDLDFTGNTAVSNSSYSVSNNTLTNCTASSSTSSSSRFPSASSSSYGLNTYGGGISVVVGAYSYSYSHSYSAGNRLFFTGNTSVSNSSYSVSNNTLTNCTASSSTSSSSTLSSASSSSYGSNTYGGGISVVVGAYSYSNRIIPLGSVFFTLVYSVYIEVSSVTCVNCRCSSDSSGFADEAFAFGGAVSLLFESYAYPKLASDQVTETAQLSRLSISHCNFSQSISSSSSESCSPRATNAAGGALYASVLGADVAISSSAISHSSTRTGCAASASETYSVGGGVAVVLARDVAITATNVTHCFTHGVSQAINVFVSGGGVFVQAESLSLESSSINSSGVEDAFSVRVVASGGGALGTKNVTAVRICNSRFYDNSDSSSTGVVLLQQLNLESGMVVNISGSVLSTDPSISIALPILNISCGSNCSAAQQKRVRLYVENSTLLAQNPSGESYQSAAVMSLPRVSPVTAANSVLRCNFTSDDSIAALAKADVKRILITCAPCDKPFFIAMTSRTLNLSVFSSFAEQAATSDSCRPLISKSLAATSDKVKCPFGISSCTTIAKVAVGFWANFTANGSISDATRCPPNYCGCRNIPMYSDPSCQLFPLFAAEYQPEEALCSGNRTGVLCGGCKPNFTQSLNGYSCISNEECSQNVAWTWAVTIIGYIIFSIYIVYSSTQVSDGLITCLLFYGQMSSFAIVSEPSATSAETSQSSLSSWFARITQFESISSLRSQACLGVNMGAYAVTAAQLCGPAIVLIFSLAFTLVLKLGRKNNEKFSMLVTLSVVILLIFSSVATVVFKLVTCARITIGNTNDDVVFIDGTVKCYDGNRNGLLAVVAILCLFPFLYAAALRRGWLSQSVQMAVCGAFNKEEGIYWGVVTSIFRLVMSMIFTTIRDVPSTAALIQLFLCVAILILMMYQNPYREATTYRFDILCYAVLTIQFGLTVLVSVSQSLGVSTSENDLYFATLKRSAMAITYLRYVLRCLMLSFLLNFVVVSCFALGRYVTFIVGATLWLYLNRTSINDKISFSYRSLKGYGKACFDSLCFACFTRFKYGQPAAQGVDLAKGLLYDFE
jgi:hypothetical protein